MSDLKPAEPVDVFDIRHRWYFEKFSRRICLLADLGRVFDVNELG
jgi:hypothetical protein